MSHSYICIGIMSGNSLDAIDAVITRFDDTEIHDLGGHSLPVPPAMAQKFRTLKQQLADNNGDIDAIERQNPQDFFALIEEYTRLTAETVNQALEKYNINSTDIDAIGFHGQTCAHLPPSIAKSTNPNDVYTLQLGDAQLLADLTNIPVVFDFRSDDLMNGGEAAPLAPVHNLHLAQNLRHKNIFPVAFCNAGNTGNLAVTTQESVFGFDTGPFNHFIDYLAQTEKNQPCDFDGQFGKQGKINFELLRTLFNQSVLTKNGDNFLLRTPPKSSDPAWYRIIPELTDNTLSFYDRIRTVEYFSSYIFTYSLKYLPDNTFLPKHYLLFGGGWKNPLVFNDFTNLLHGKMQVLPEHEDLFKKIAVPNAQISWSDKYGFNGQYMEARIFADMAKCYLAKEAFSFPETTGCQSPTIGGIIIHPGQNIRCYRSRAAKGWHKK